MKKIFIILMIAFPIYSQIYVSTDGHDQLNDGTILKPYRTITKAFDAVKTKGDTIYLRSGIYEYNETLEPQISGSESNYKCLFAFENEKPIIDFAGQAYSSSNRGIKLSEDYWHLKGLEIMNAGDNGIHISGHYNIVENCELHHNKDTGLQISNGGSNNKILNCDSYLNYDPGTHGENADGFAPKLDIGPGNYFKNCRAYFNSDDGWDCYEGQNQIIIDSCWAFHNGYNIWGDDSFQGDGNGFKLGGNYIPAPHIIKNSVAFDNVSKGFDQNHNMAGITVLNCTAFRNGRNYSFNEEPTDSVHILMNNISFDGSNSISSSSTEEYNSWNGFFVAYQDFEILDTSLARIDRDENFNLPATSFLRLSEGSQLIDAGIDVGIPYLGDAPDLGAFEYNPNVTSIQNNKTIANKIKLAQNYPNPFNPTTTIEYTIPKNNLGNALEVSMVVFNILGEQVETILEGRINPGNYSIEFNAENLVSGIYYYKLSVGNSFITRKMAIVK